jgi:hypothetical protein
MINHPDPILKGDVAITEPSPVKILQGAPIWQEPLIVDTTFEIIEKIAEPKPIIVTPKQIEKDSSIHIKKPRR